MPTGTPLSGQVYSWRGQPALFIRTEQRPGATQPQHLFIITRDRMPSTVWLDEMPAEFELIIDHVSRGEMNDLGWQLVVAEHERTILADLLKRACEWLPRDKGQELRRLFRDTRPQPRKES